MLILTRTVGESIQIGDDIRVTVLGVAGNQVRTGVDAPKNVAVHRKEIWERIQAGVPREEEPRVAEEPVDEAEPIDERRAAFLARGKRSRRA